MAGDERRAEIEAVTPRGMSDELTMRVPVPLMRRLLGDDVVNHALGSEAEPGEALERDFHARLFELLATSDRVREGGGQADRVVEGGRVSDERRAEIEAVARFYYRWMMGDDYPEFPWDDDNTPSNETKDEAERFAAEFALDRVRDARGDNEAEKPWKVKRCPTCAELDSNTFVQGCSHREPTTLIEVAARSPQDEDSISPALKAATQALCRHENAGCLPNVIDAARDVVDAYLSRVSPSPERDTKKP